MYAISATTEYPEEAAKLLEFLLNSRDMAQLQGTEKGIPISDAAKAALQETQKLSGYEKQADDMRENYADRLEILQPVLENESVYDGFKVNADYYIYDKLSEDEVVEKLYEAIY
jgi:oligogalacturonide transport system substrate-binding protein